MSDDQTQGGQGPDADECPVAPGELCPNALPFIWGATKLVETQIQSLGQPGTDPDHVRKVVGLIMRDIRRQIVEKCPEANDANAEETNAIVCCSTCLTSYNKCIAAGTSSSICMSRYSTCLSTCNNAC